MATGLVAQDGMPGRLRCDAGQACGSRCSEHPGL